MGRKPSNTLTRGELRLMKVLWEKGNATVNDVVEALPARRRLAYNTVLTTLRILERKGYLRREKEGRAHVYHPVVDRASARRSALQDVLDHFFESSPELLLQNVLEDDALDSTDLERLREMIGRAESRTDR